MYRERMNSYFPQVLQTILEFQAIIDAEYPEIENIEASVERITTDAYLTTMSEERVEQWERMLNIYPIDGSTLSDRREVIIARIRGQGKLNTSLINAIVNTFTGGSAISWVQDSVLYVAITPPPDNKHYLFPNVEQELRNKLPAHLDLQVSRNYYEWQNIKNAFSTWEDVKNGLGSWNDVYLYVPFKQGGIQ